MDTKAYDDFSQDYDRFVDWEERFKLEMPFILEELNAQKNENETPRILDAACGTGMHAIYLSKEGFITAGTDYSPEMIKKAQANARSAYSKAVFKTAGFGEIKENLYRSPLLPFDALLCLGNSLPHMLTRGTVKTALLDFCACLRPGGFLMLQNRNFDLVMQEQQRWLGTQSYRDGEDEWLFLRFYDFEADGLITFNIVRLHRHADEPWQENISSVKLFPIKRDMLVELLKESGFTDIRTFGRMAREPFDALTSPNLVITAIKTT